MSLDKLRDHFFDLNIHATVIPSADPHQSEYLSDHWKLREWLSGFTGSAATLVITRHHVGLWTDSRYYLQAEEELEGSGITLFKEGEDRTPSITEYLIKHLAQGEKVALNARIWSHQGAMDIKEKLDAAGLDLCLDLHPAEDIWDKVGRPGLPTEKVFIHEHSYAGVSVWEKLERVREKMKALGVKQHLITTLDDLAWLFNLRGHDIAFNPVFHAYGVVRDRDAILFIDPGKIDPTIEAHLSQAGVLLRDYDSVRSFLESTTDTILINPNDCSEDLFGIVRDEVIIEGDTITRRLKAIKTSSDVAHIDDAMIQDGVALAHAFYELEQRVGAISEAEFAQVIAGYRSEQKGYYGESFPAIVGYESNGAIVHYRPKSNDSAVIKPEGLLLCDSGGQYLNGTTDITRTVAMGHVSDQQRESYTRVLKGHIAIDRAIFPKGTSGGMLDILARQFLWQNGQNYGHGTGHGVGFFLNVHEPPNGISPGSGSRSTTILEPGMLTSNEPGYYEEGAYGIRIENLILCEESEHEGYLRHRHVTLFPIETSIIKYDLMTRDEITWINSYHRLVASKLLPHLSGEVADWMRKSCEVI